ncbi:AraC family transcriptional regulator [Sinimarinibacterium sp. CAU 1509]|nr:AraC family transcriptional regulator [Sinimarinibacterium sp. CAU 1509]
MGIRQSGVLTNAAVLLGNHANVSSNRNIPHTGVIAALYARGLLDYLRARGVDPTQLYAPDRVAHFQRVGGHVEIPLAEWIAMFDTAVDALGEPDLPLKAGGSLHLRHLGVLGHVLMNCATLEEVYLQLARYIRLLGQIGQPALSLHGDEAHLLWSWPYDSPPADAVAQFMLGARAMFMRWLTNRPDLRYDAYFHFPRPRDTRAYEQIFGGALHFSQPHSKMVFSRDYLTLPVVSADEELRQQVEAQAQSLLQQLSGEPPLLRELRSFLARNLANGRVSLELSAQALGTSARTLQRRLSESNLSFQTALDQVRQARAEALLRDPTVSLTQIAFLLGYTEQSTFHNAFRRWTHCSPGAFRRRQRSAT